MARLKNRVLLSAAATLGFVCFLGCGRSASPDEIAIRAVVQKANQALLEGDRAAALSYYAPSPESESFVAAVGGFCGAARRFRGKLVEHHGEKGFDEFNAAPGFKLHFNDAGEDPGDAAVDIDGDQAIVTWRGKARPAQLVRQQGEWKLSSPSSTEVALVVEQLGLLAQALEANLDNIGDPAISPASLSRAMGDRIGVQAGQTFADRYTPVH